MSAFYDNDITNNGLSLLAEVELGAVFVPTRIVMGSGFIPEGKTARTMTEVSVPVCSMIVTRKSQNPDGSVVFGANFSNKDTAEAFYYRELGLYAKCVRPDGTNTEEMLYSYGNAHQNAELIPAYESNMLLERRLDLITYIGNDANVKLELSSGLTVDLETYEKEVTELRQLLQTITDLYALKTEVGDLTELATNAKENLVAAINELKQAASDAGYFYGDDGTKYRWGKDDIGIYCEDVIDPNVPADVVLELGEGGDTGYYAEIEGQTKAIENAVESVEKLTEGKIFFEILEEGEARE